MYDEKGMVIPPAKADEGESGTSATPPDPNATAKAASATAENTAATPPSPDAKPPAAVEPPPAEDKSGKVDKTAETAGAGKPPAAEPPAAAGSEEETEDQLKARLARPTDSGDEWRIRAYREGQSLRKKLTPVLTQMERIASPERAARGLDFVADFAEPEVEISDAVEKMTVLSSSRTQELSNFFYEAFLDHYPDVVATDLIGEVDEQGQTVKVTATELKEAVKLLRSGATAGSTAQPQSTATGAATATPKEVTKPEGVSAEDWETFKLDYPDVFKAMEAQAKVAEPPPTPPAAKTEDPKVAELTSKLTDIERQQLERQQEAARNEILTKGNEFHEQAFSVVKEGLRELGLEPDPAKDDDRTIRLKKDTANSIRTAVEAELDGPDGPNGSMDWSLCTEEQKENRKLAVKIMGLLTKQDYTAAFDYLDVAKARYDLAFQRVAEPKIELYNAAMGQPSTPTRNAGQEGHKRPEIVDGSAAAAGSNGQSKTPWLDPGFKRPDETVWDAMDRYTETHGIPGRQNRH
jgi:hypothetical protein